jgi:cytochrome c55X
MKRLIVTLALGATVSLAGTALASGVDAARQGELKDILDNTCITCHGPGLTGGVGPALNADTLKGKEDGMLQQTILNGRPDTPMPPFGGMLSADDAAWIVKHLKGEN